ncbi:MAG: phosphoglycerate mutase family protein [bacterium]|nr:phosphoglycerate mutase family protein [bacterium]
MSTLILIRHGQAMFGTEDYDRLSPLGIEQSNVLGQYWARRRRGFDAVFSGAMVRQKQTLRTVGEILQKAGLSFPEGGIITGFNEYDSRGIMTHLYPRLLEEDPRIREVAKRYPGIGDGSPEGRRAFQQIFEIVLERWLEDPDPGPETESFPRFQDRVIAGIEKIRSEYASGKTVAVFTSGGAISIALQHALSLSGRKALSLQWIIKNSSITEFTYSQDRFTLAGFNQTPHLEDEGMITYR